MKRIAIETVLVEREYIVDIPTGESEEITRQRVLKCNDDGVVILPNSDRFVESVGVVLRDLKPGESEDYVIRRMEETKEIGRVSEVSEGKKKRGRPPKISLDKSREADIMDEQESNGKSQLEIMKELLA